MVVGILDLGSRDIYRIYYFSKYFLSSNCRPEVMIVYYNIPASENIASMGPAYTKASRQE